MTDTILVAVNDSPAAFHAAFVAVGLAHRLGSRLRAVSVVTPGSVADGIADLPSSGVLAARAALRHVDVLGRTAAIEVDVIVRFGTVAAQILDEALACDATLIVMARGGRPGHILPHLGSTTQHVLEFSTVPVLVVPAPRPR